MTDEWYVLIEEDTRETERADGVELKLHRWMLVGTHHINGDQEQATAAAKDAALHYLPGVLARHTQPGTPSSPRTGPGWCSLSSGTVSVIYGCQ
ncbi:hypothetical protein ACFVXA_37565 [Streptomyces sp. NPDC058246]|uniref:hypothetical protein n=1 Tax=Streptomyces sp. NPDC058246 TaxID=3346400 RepID=UPI0036EB93FF